MSISIGVPCRDLPSNLHEILSHLSAIDAVSEILVSFNGPITDTQRSFLVASKKIKYFFQEENLGLYGNFRFLLNQASCDFFAWNCIDDLVTPDLEPVLKSMRKSRSNLGLVSIREIEWNDELCAHLGEGKEGILPCINSRQQTINSAIHAQPNWIFGIWRTAFLKKIFPKSNFDWLDVYIVQKALLHSKVTINRTVRPSIVGTHNKNSRKPHSVKGYHSYRKYSIYCLSLTPKTISSNPKLILRWIKQIYDVRNLAKELNK